MSAIRAPSQIVGVHFRIELLVGTIGLLAGFLGLTYVFGEEWWRDRRFALHSDRPFSDSLVVVGVDETYVEWQGNPEPVPLSYLAAVVRAATALEPSALALDVAVSAADSARPGFGELAGAVRAARAAGIAVVLPTRLATRAGDTRIVLRPPPSFGEVGAGFAEPAALRPSDETGAVARSFPALAEVARNCQALAFAVAAVAAHRRLAGTTVPCDGPGTLPDTAARHLLEALGVPGGGVRPVPLDYAGSVTRTSRLRYFPSDDLFDSTAVPRALTAGRMVLVVPLHAGRAEARVFRTPVGESVPTELVHLHAIDTLLRRSFPRRAASVAGWVLASLLFVGTLVAWRRRASRVLLLTAATAVGVVSAGLLLFSATQLMVPIAPPLYAVLAGAVLGFILYGRLGDDAAHVDVPPASASAPSGHTAPVLASTPPPSTGRVRRAPGAETGAPWTTSAWPSLTAWAFVAALAFWLARQASCRDAEEGRRRNASVRSRDDSEEEGS